METIEFVPLSGVWFPRDFAWRAGLCELIIVTQRGDWPADSYRPPRFTGYFFLNGRPVGVCCHGCVYLPRRSVTEFLDLKVTSVAGAHCRIASMSGDPDFLMVHDGWDSRCWLVRFGPGLDFFGA